MDLIYNKIGTGYNATRQADPYLTERLLYLLKPKKDKLYLDIGCGTGNYTCALADKGFKFIGVEPSEKMLNEAKMRNQNVTWLKGTAEQIPAGNKVFEGIIATLTIHHWTDIKQALSELNRVLSDTGRIVIFTSTPEQMQGYWLNYYFPKMMQSSIIQMPSIKKLSQILKKTGFRIVETEKYDIQDNLEDLFLYSGKHRPELYLKPEIRRGISSFSSLANEQEVTNGLAKLAKEIKTGIIKNVIDEFKTNLGDYLFIVACK
ncbi:class I SAM-dependent methyltransferase [Aquiflexum sp.]|uniref:class I SAM-dependent methyltransferase n=1 Tax=Aquiflexum sp. TaxID=1872584 RepID=UPI0035947DA6